MTKKIIKRTLTVLLIVFALTIGFVIAIRSYKVQTFLAHRATEILSNSLNTKVSIERVQLSFFQNAELINFYLEDHQGDTLISTKNLKVSFSVFSLLKKKISIHELMLENAVVHLHRDSAGLTNITEVFKSRNSATEDTSQSAGNFQWDLNLNQIRLQNVDFHYFDDKSHTNVAVALEYCGIDVNQLALDKKLINIQSAKLDGADVKIDLTKRAISPDDDSIMRVQFMLGGLQVQFNEFALTNTRFRMTDHNSDTVLLKGMDFKHLDIQGINLTAQHGKIVGDSIVAEITGLTAKERSGFQLLNLKAQARVSINDITLEKLTLKTANSEVGNYLSFRFNAYHDFKDFLNAVRIRADFTGTELALKDLGYFVKNLDKVEHNRFTLNGQIDGRVNNLKGRGIEIRGGSSTLFKGDFYTRGLPNIYETSLNLRVKRLATTVQDIKRFYPQAKLPQNLSNLGLIYYTGLLDGFVTDFVSKGRVVTSLGSAVTDVNFKYDKKQNKAAYKGNLALNEFDLGKFFNDEIHLGKVSLTGKVDGGGLTLESLHANLEGVVSKIQLQQYDYHDIQVNGYIVRKSFNGLLQIHDENLDLDFNGRADMSKDIPEFKFDANVRKAVLKNLNLMKPDIRVSGKMKIDIKGKKIDDIVGSVSLKDVTISRDTVQARVKYLSLNAKLLSNEQKEIKLNSDFMEAEMNGNFTLKELPVALLSFAKRTFTNNYKDTTSTTPQNFSADVRIYEPGTITQIISPAFYHIRNSRIQGGFNSVDHSVHLKVVVPEFEFAAYHVHNVDVDSRFENGTIDFHAVADKVYHNDSLMLDTLQLLTHTLADKDIRFDLLLADKKNYNRANMTAFLTPLSGKAAIRFDTSDIKLGNYNWHFLPNNYVLVEGKKITTNNLVFKTVDQTIYISSYLKNDTSTSVKLTLDNTDIGDFAGIFTQKTKDIQGAMNGKLVLEDIFYKPTVYADVVVNEFTLGNELIGDVNIETSLDEANKKIQLYASVKSINNLLEAKGYISIDAEHPDLKIDINAPRLGINFLNYKFFEKYVKDCRGYAQVNATMYGTIKKPLLSGNVLLVNDTVTVSFLNTTYHIQQLNAKLDEHGFNFGSFSLFDINDNIIHASGRINHESFRKFALDLEVTTPNAQFINTTAKQSPNFYGVAYGAGNITFKGDINSPVIKAYAMTKPGTYCRFPITTTYETNKYSFYKFTDGKREKVSVQTPLPHLKLNGVNFILELDATPDARMDIILDPAAGDVLASYGRGNLKIEIPKNGSTTIYGNYEIERGNYLFTLQSIVNKRFEINKGGTINFTGEVYKAALNVDATYQIRSSVSDLIDDLINNQPSSNQAPASQNQLTQLARNRVPVKLMLNLSGILEKPNIGFGIQAIDLDPAIKSYVDQKLNLLKTNESELNKQVFGLLVMNRFLPSGSTGDILGKGNYAGATAANTVSEFLSSQLNNYLSNLLSYSGSDALKNLDINFGYRQYDQQNGVTDVNGNTGTSFDTRRELQLALQQRLLNNRLTINAGGNLDFGNSTQYNPNGVTSSSRSVIPTGDFQIQYALTPDGTWSAKAFNRTNYDYTNSRNTNRTGIGIAYRQEFDKPSELKAKFKKKPKQEKQKKAKQKKKDDKL